MAPLSLKIVQDDGAVTRKVKLDPNMTVLEATAIVKEKALLPPDAKPYGLFLRSLDNPLAGVWLEDDRPLHYYVLRDGDRVDYMCRFRNLRLRMLDGAVKTLQVDQSKLVVDLMFSICSKLAITNHEEYGLCFDPDEVAEEESKSAQQTGTLTIKKKSTLHVRDIEFEQLSKKLKTDDNVEWIDLHKTLSETSIDPSRTLLLKRRLYYSDRKVDSRDPIQLNLLYVQARDNILTSRHPVTELKAAEFAGIQCHIQFGDYNEEKHKPGLIENLREYLPEQYCSSWGIEKKILKEFSKHVGTSELEAKHLYTKTARSLPTYGVTFFLVKEVQKGKKKLIHRLLGINAEAILRLDENTKEIIQEWPLTHVKTYSAGQGNSFTLNFGDYTDQEYSVKTRDAFRIRDILEGYIDLIRKRMLAQYHAASTDHGYLTTDNVGANRANTITVVANNSMQMMEQSFVGPSKIVEYEPGQKASQGTQIVTVQQMITSSMANKHGQGVKSEVPREDEFHRTASCRLKRVNSKSVKVVTLLTDPSDNNIDQARKLVEELNSEMPFVKEGVQQSADKQQSAENKKKLEDQLRELDELVRTLTHSTEPAYLNTEEAEAAAIKIADASTQMYLSLDPGTRRRSAIMKRQRDSFVSDERTEKTLRVASYIAAAADTQRALQRARDTLREEYSGPALDSSHVDQLERAARDKLAKINAAIAHHLLAYSDPSNVDYSTAVNSLHTIQELIPELAKDAQALASVKDGKSREELLESIQELSEAAKAVCQLNGRDSQHNDEKKHEVIENYTQAGGKLLFILGRGSRPMGDKEKEIVELALEAERQTSALAQCGRRQAGELPSAPAVALYGAAARAAAAAAALTEHAHLTAPTIEEAHCRSALTAASEAVSSSVQQLVATWTPLVDDNTLTDKLHHQTMDLTRTLDRLKNSYAHLDGANGDVDIQDSSPEGQKLKFIHTLGDFQNKYRIAMDEVNKPVLADVSPAQVQDTEMRLSERLGQLNAAIAALNSAYADQENPDYAAAESAISVINSLIPEIAKDARVVSANKDADSRAALLEQVRDLYRAMDSLQAGPDKFTNDEALKLAGESGKLVYIVGKRINPAREDVIMDLSTEACNQASVLLSTVQRVAEGEGGERGGLLDERGASLADTAERLLATAQITSPSISSPACRSRLLGDIQSASDAAQQLSVACDTFKHDPAYEAQARSVQEALKLLQEQLDKLREACDIPDLETQEQTRIIQSSPQEQHKLEFMMSLQDVQNKLGHAETVLEMPRPTAGSDPAAVRRRLTDRLALLDDAIRSLYAATDADKPDYMAAQQAMTTISELMPLVVHDANTASVDEDESSRSQLLAHVRDLCRDTQLLCATAGNEEDFKEAVKRCADSSNKLVFIVSSRKKSDNKLAMTKSVADVSDKAKRIEEEVRRVAGAAAGAGGAALEGRGADLARAVRDLVTAAQTHQSPPALQAATSVVLRATRSLRDELLSRDTSHADLIAQLMMLDGSIATLYDVCQHEKLPSAEEQKLHFIKSMRELDDKFADVQKQLNKPGTAPRGDKAATLGAPHSLAKLNAALAALHHALADRKRPNYATAQQSMSTISELLPLVVQDIKASSLDKDEQTRGRMLAELRELCDAAQLMCTDDGTDSESYKRAVAKLTAASNKLTHAVTPDVNTYREQQILDLAHEAYNGAAQLQSEAKRVSEEVGGELGSGLVEGGGEVGDAVGDMMQTVQLLAPTISEPQCRETLLRSVSRVTLATLPLRRDVAALRDVTQQRALDRALQRLDGQLQALREACDMPDDAAPTLSKKPAVPTKPAVSQRPGQALPNRNNNIHATAEFLNTLRHEETQAHPTSVSSQETCTKPSIVEVVPVKKTAEEIRVHEEFVRTTEDAAKSIKRDEKILLQLSKSKEASGVVLSNSQMLQHQQLLHQHLALAAVEVAGLVAASYVDKIDYATATSSTKKLAELMSKVCDNGKHLSDNVEEQARRVLLHDVTQVCAAGRKICDAARTDRQKLNEAAVEFGDKSAKLLSVVSNDVDPELEKEIISRVKAIGTCTSQLASDTATAASDTVTAASDTVTAASDTVTAASDTVTAASATHGDVAQQLCDVAARCVDAAGKLLYTAKVTAPTLQMRCSQQALVSSAESVSGQLQQYRAALPALPALAAPLHRQADQLHELLEALRDDVRDGNLSRRRELEQLVVENTPLRELTVKIMDGAKAYTELSAPGPRVQLQYAAYSDRVARALAALDLAAARCHTAPHDKNKRTELDNAIQNLQMILLQSRPTRGEKGNSNIVDLRDFIEEVSSEAKAMTAAAYEVKVPTAQDKKILGDIREKCGVIETKAQQLMNFDDMLEIDQLAQECDDLISQINADIKGIDDAKAKRALLTKMLPLSESTNMLRFATKSSISATASANLDGTLEDLEDIEERLVPSIVQHSNGNEGSPTLRGSQQTRTSQAASQLCCALTGAAPLAPALTAYLTAPHALTGNKLARHLYKTVHLTRALTAARGRRAALWQPADCAHVALITRHVVQEIQSNSENGSEVKDVAMLLVPSAPKILSDDKEQEASLQHLSEQVSSLSASLVPATEQTGGRPQRELSERGTALVAAANELDAIARGCYTTHPMQSRQIDEAAKQMKLDTYNVLQIAEAAAKDPRNLSLSRRLAAARERLNSSINKLMRSSSVSPAVSQCCGAMSRDLTQRARGAAPRPAPAPLDHALQDLHDQREYIYKLKNDQVMPREQFLRDLDEIGTAVRKSADLAENCAYFVAVSDEHKEVAKTGLVDVSQIQKSIESIQDTCIAIIGASEVIQALDEREELHRRVQELSWSLEKAQAAVRDEKVKATLAKVRNTVCDAAQDLEGTLKEGQQLSNITSKAVELLQCVDQAHSTVEQCPLVPALGHMTPDTQQRCEQIIGQSKSLLSNTLELVSAVSSSCQQQEQETLSWSRFPARRKVVDDYDALVKVIRINGHRSGILVSAPEEEVEDEAKKSYIETQVDLANKWLKNPTPKTNVKAVGQQAVRNVVDIGREISEELSGSEREESRALVADIEELLAVCSKQQHHEKASLLMDRMKELRRTVERCVVTRVVEDFMLAELPLQDLEELAGATGDVKERKYILERKLASLLTQLGRVTRTARLLAAAGSAQPLDDELAQLTRQTELLAPMLVKAAQQRIDHPDDQSSVEKYAAALCEYAAAMCRVRECCDRALDPMQFVQAAGDTMQRMREDMTHNSDPQKCHYTSSAINRLANRVVCVGLWSPAVRTDPALGAELCAAQRRLRAAPPAPPGDWRQATDEVMRVTGDVESALGGENIFKEQPTTANQPIYSVARDLHEAVREWSARDNEIVGTARRMAVLMARLSDYMQADKKQALITTSKSIVAESQEVAELAKKLAHECTDVRIKTNLLQLVDRIPTISGQLKMLITVKGSSLGQQGNFEDKEAMDMLVVNAQSLMISIQEVVKAAAGASVKIMSQHGPRLRWVRKNYY